MFTSVLVLIVALFSQASAEAVNTRDCGATNGQILQISGPTCLTTLCTYKPGDFVNLDVKFKTDSPTDFIVNVYSVLFKGRPVPLHSWASDLCFLLGSCPLAAGEHNYKISMQIPKEHPRAISAINKIEVKSSDSKLICVLYLMSALSRNALFKMTVI